MQDEPLGLVDKPCPVCISKVVGQLRLWLRVALPLIECNDSNGSGLVTVIGEYLNQFLDEKDT